MPANPYLEFFSASGAGVAAGTLSGLFGVGGGIVLVPLLSLLLGIDQHRAQGLSLTALLFPNTLPAILHFRRQNIPCHWKLAGWLILCFLPGTWCGATVANHLPATPLRMVFVIFLGLLAWKTFHQSAPAPTAEQPAALNTLWAIPIGLLGGLCSGLLGIGGGVIMIPLMVLLLKLPQHEAQLTSLLVMLPPVGLPGVWVYCHAQPIPWRWILGLALGFQLGALLGARMATRLSPAKLKYRFGWLMVFLAILLLLRL